MADKGEQAEEVERMSGERKWRRDFQVPNFTVTHTYLSFDIQDAYVEVEARLLLKRHPQARSGLPCLLNGENLQLQWLEIDGRRLDASEYVYDRGNSFLSIANPPEKFEFRSSVRIDPYNNKALNGFYQSGDILCSQNEPEGFRCITFFPDRPDVMSLFDCEISADKKRFPVLLANGNLIEKRASGHDRHYVKWRDPFPKPCYLFAIVAGDLDHISDHFITASGRKVALEIYTDPGRSHLASFAMEALKKSMLWDEQNYGREYDLDLFMIVAVDSFNFGAMENKGLNIFNSRLVFADPKLATDDDFMAVEGVIAHEYFHNWTGNRITCRDWFQLTLKEGLTVYRDEEFSATQINPSVKRVADVNFLRLTQYPEDAGPNRHPIRPESYMSINNFYTPTVYRKGAAVIRMMAEYVGPDNFRKGMDIYFARFDGMAVCCDDFVDAIQEGSGVDLQSLRRWYSQAGTPRVEVTMAQQGTKVILTLHQTHPDAGPEQLPLGIPFPVALYSSSGQLLGEQLPLLEQEETKIEFDDINERPIPSLLKNHIAPVISQYDYQEDELLVLFAHDRDPFNRYEAGQRLAKRYLLQMCAAPTTVPPSAFWQVLRTLLNNADLAPDYRALLLNVPSVQEITDLQSPPQFQHVWQQRRRFLRLMATELASDGQRWFEEMSGTNPNYSPQLAARRNLRLQMASILAAAGPQNQPLILDYYRRAVNMSETAAALRLLCHYFPGDTTDEILVQFAQQWQAEPLVLCKWFATQASVVAPDALAQVQKLSQHPLFERDNPNMVRSLYGVLAANLPVFHQHDGQGYRLIADQIIRIDAFNPQLASGLAKKFLAFGRLSPSAATLMKEQLQRILATAHLTVNTYEPVAAIMQEGEDRQEC